MASATRTRRPTGRHARGSTHRTQGLRRRRQPEPSGLKKMVGAVLPAVAARKAAPSSKKGRAGGLAVLAAAAGVAFKNRDRLMRSDRKGSAAPPGTPAV